MAEEAGWIRDASGCCGLPPPGLLAGCTSGQEGAGRWAWAFAASGRSRLGQEAHSLCLLPPGLPRGWDGSRQ